MADQTSAASVIRIGISILAHVVRTHSLAKSRVVRAGNAVRRTCCHNTLLITLLSASSWCRLTAISPGVYTRVGRCQKDKIYLDFTEAIDSEWQWHQLGHMQVCISLMTDKNASTPPLSFYRSDALPAAQPTASKNWRQQWCLLTIFKTVDVYYVRHT